MGPVHDKACIGIRIVQGDFRRNTDGAVAIVFAAHGEAPGDKIVLPDLPIDLCVALVVLDKLFFRASIISIGNGSGAATDEIYRCVVSRDGFIWIDLRVREEKGGG